MQFLQLSSFFIHETFLGSHFDAESLGFCSWGGGGGAGGGGGGTVPEGEEGTSEGGEQLKLSLSLAVITGEMFSLFGVTSFSWTDVNCWTWK